MSELGAAVEIATKCPPSSLYNNLSWHDQFLCYASQQDIVVVRPLGATRLPQLDVDKAQVTSVSIVGLRGTAVACYSTATKVHLWDVKREAKLCTIQLSVGEARALRIIEKNGKMIAVVGHGDGKVTFVSLSDSFEAGVPSTTEGHDCAVSASAISNDSPVLAATGDVGGTISTWSEVAQVGRISFAEDTVTSIVLQGTQLIAAYGLGKIRFFDAASLKRRMEICAHGRWINAMTYHPQCQLLATAADDGVICVWNASGLVKYKALANALPTGIAFTADGVACASYDNDKLSTFAL